MSSTVTAAYHHYSRAYFFLITALIIFGCTGCMHKSAPEEASPKEELYIDAKLGFTIIHPLLWEKIKVPVSSPSYRKNVISWDIPDEYETGTMLIRIFPALPSATVLTELLGKFLENKPDHSKNKAEPYKHIAGDTVATTIKHQEHTERLFAIQGSYNAYVLSFIVRADTFDEKSDLFDKIAESFREL